MDSSIESINLGIGAGASPTSVTRLVKHFGGSDSPFDLGVQTRELLGRPCLPSKNSIRVETWVWGLVPTTTPSGVIVVCQF